MRAHRVGVRDVGLDRLGSGQAQPHQRPAAAGAIGGDAPALPVGHLAHDRKAEPRAGMAAGLGAPVEAVEHVRKILAEIAGP